MTSYAKFANFAQMYSLGYIQVYTLLLRECWKLINADMWQIDMLAHDVT
jgi:hypothetical protein